MLEEPTQSYAQLLQFWLMLQSAQLPLARWFKDGSPLTRERLVKAVQQALAEAGIDTTGSSGHSFQWAQPPGQLMLA